MSRTFTGGDTEQLTYEVVAKKVVDGILDGGIITSLIYSNAKPYSGISMGLPMKYAKSTTGGFYTGMGPFSASVENNLTRMKWTPASLYQSVTLPSMELAVNKSQPIIDQKKYAMESAKQDMIDRIGDCFYGDGSANAYDGLKNIVDDGSVASTYATLTRASYDMLDADVDTSVGSITLDTIGDSIDAATVGAHEPKLILTTKTLWRAIEDLLFPSVQATYGAAGSKRGKINRLGDVGAGQAMTGLAGYTAIYYRGIPIVKDDKCTSGYIYYLNTDFLYWAGLPHPDFGTVDLGGGIIEGVDNEAPSNHGIAWTGWMRPTLQDGNTAQFLQYGNLICESPRHQACDQGCTA